MPENLETGNYSLKITSVYETTPETTDENAPDADRVVVVIYEYSNDDISNGLVISSAHFKAYDKSGKELKIYPQSNLFEPGEISALGTHTASVAFAISNSDKNYIQVNYYELKKNRLNECSCTNRIWSNIFPINSRKHHNSKKRSR